MKTTTMPLLRKLSQGVTLSVALSITLSASMSASANEPTVAATQAIMATSA